MVTVRTDEYELDDDPNRIDIDAAFDYIVGQSYFGHGRTRATFAESIRQSARVVGLYTDDAAMVGFARVISDGHTFAYLADVYVLDEHQGRGLGTALVKITIESSSFANARWMLGTRDAHSMYRKFGFDKPSERMMERPRRDP